MHLFEKLVCHKKKPPKHPRKNGFSLPPHPIQVLGWVLLLGFECIYVGAVVPTLPNHWIVTSHIINGFLFGIQLVLELWVMYINPAHPNLLKNWRSEVAPFERTKHSHVIENYHCNICDIDVQEDCKHCVECNKCVANFDHHCKWLNTCIGGRNYREFFSYISVCFILFLWLAGINIAVVVMFFAQKSLLGPHKIAAILEDDKSDSNKQNNTYGNWSSITYQVTELLVFVPVSDVVWISVICTNLVLLVLATSLLTYLVQLHIRLIFKQTTTYKMILEKREKLKNSESSPSKFLMKTQFCSQRISIAPAPLTHPMGSQDMEYIIRPGLAMPVKEKKWNKKLINRKKNTKWCGQNHDVIEKSEFQKKLHIAMSELPVLQAVYPPQVLKMNGSVSSVAKNSSMIQTSNDALNMDNEGTPHSLNAQNMKDCDQISKECVPYEENGEVHDYSEEVDANTDSPADILRITRLSNISRLGSTQEIVDSNPGVPDEVDVDDNEVSCFPQPAEIKHNLRLEPIRKPTNLKMVSDHQDTININSKETTVETSNPVVLSSQKISKSVSSNLESDMMKVTTLSSKSEDRINHQLSKHPTTPILVRPRQEEKTGFHVVTISNENTPTHQNPISDTTTALSDQSLSEKNEETSNSNQSSSNKENAVFFRVQRTFPLSVTPKDQPHLSALSLLDHVKENDITFRSLSVHVPQENTENANMYI